MKNISKIIKSALGVAAVVLLFAAVNSTLFAKAKKTDKKAEPLSVEKFRLNFMLSSSDYY